MPAFVAAHIFILLHNPGKPKRFFVLGCTGFCIANFEKPDNGFTVFVFCVNGVSHKNKNI
jgi:hypothetical protein